MRKKTWFIIIAVFLLAAAITAYVLWQKEQERWAGLQKEWRDEEKAIEDAYPANKKKLEDFYVLISKIYTQIDSLDLQQLLDTENGRETYQAWLAKSPQPYDFRFFPYEVMYQAAHEYYKDSARLNGDWPWTIMYNASWVQFPILDSNLIKLMPGGGVELDHSERQRHPDDLDMAASGLPDVSKEPYLHIIYRITNGYTDHTELDKSFLTRSGPHEYTGVFTPGVFDGFLIVYNLEKMEIVKTFHFQYESSEKISYSTEQNAYDPKSEFRQAFANNLESNFRPVILTLISDSLGLKDNTYTINGR